MYANDFTKRDLSTMGISALTCLMNHLCLAKVWSEGGERETLMWAFQPYGHDECGNVIGFMRVWHTSEIQLCNGLVYDDRALTMHDHLISAILRVQDAGRELEAA